MGLIQAALGKANEAKQIQDGVETQLVQKANLTGVNVKEFNSIQEAINYASYNNIKTVYLPDGIFNIISPIVLPSNITLCGSRNTYINCIDTSFYNWITNSDYVNGNENIEVCNIKILPTISHSTLNNYHPRGLIAFCKVNGLHIHDIYIKTLLPNQPIWLWKCNNVEVDNNNLIKNFSTNGYSGIWCMTSWENADTDILYCNYKIHNNFIHAEVDEAISIFSYYGKIENVRIYNNKVESTSTSSIAIVTQLGQASLTPLINNVSIFDNQLIGGGISLWKAINNINIYDNDISYKSFEGFTQNIKGIISILTNPSNPNYASLPDITKLKIYGNNFNNCGIALYNAFILEIFNNTINDNDFGITISNSMILADSLTKTTIIKNNVINNCPIGISSSSIGQVIKSNIFNNCSNYAIKSNLYKDKIVYNNFNNCSKCIFSNASSGGFFGVIIAGNNFYNSILANIFFDVACTNVSNSQQHLLKDNTINATSTTALPLITDQTTGTVIKPKFLYVNNYSCVDSFSWGVCNS